jgi:hypothetical protein
VGFQDLSEFLEPWLDLPIRGKKYRVDAVDAETGIYCQHVVELGAQLRMGAELTEADVAKLKLNDDQEQDFHRRVLGDAYDEMVADGIPWEYLKRASRTAFMWTVQDREAAEQYWGRGDASPEPQRPTPQDHKAPAKKKSARPGSPAGKKKTSARQAPSAGASSSPTGS